MDMKTPPLALLKDPSLIKTDALINRQWVKGSNRFNIHDPAKGAKLANVANLRTVRYQSGCHCYRGRALWWRQAIGLSK